MEPDERLAQRKEQIRQALNTLKVAFADPEQQTQVVRILAERSLAGENFTLSGEDLYSFLDFFLPSN